jgi:hypothetical protein
MPEFVNINIIMNSIMYSWKYGNNIKWHISIKDHSSQHNQNVTSLYRMYDSIKFCWHKCSSLLSLYPNSVEYHVLSLLTHHAMVSMCMCVQSVKWITSWIPRVPIVNRRAICCHAPNHSGSTYIMLSLHDLRRWSLTTISFKSVQCLIFDTHTACMHPQHAAWAYTETHYNVYHIPVVHQCK